MNRITTTLALLSCAFVNDNGSATLPDGSTVTPDACDLPLNPANFGSDDLLGLGDEGLGDDELSDEEIGAIADAVEAGVTGMGFGAEKGSAAKRRISNRLKRVQRRGKRQAEHNRELQDKLREKLGGGSGKHTKTLPGVLGASATVSAAGDYSVTISSEAEFLADELFIDGPVGTYVKSISFGESQVMPAGTNEVAISVFGPTAQGRQLVHGKHLKVGQRLIVTFTTTATSGKINVSLIGDKSPTC